MNNMYSKLNYQNVTTAAYSFAIVVFLLFGLLFLTQRRLISQRVGECQISDLYACHFFSPDKSITTGSRSSTM